MKHERRSKMQVVVQMVRMERNAAEVDDFVSVLERGARRGPGSHQGRRDQPDAARRWTCGGGLEASVPLLVARPDVREAEWRRVSLLPELYAGRRAAGEYRRASPWKTSGIRKRCSACAALHATGRADEIDVCARCCTTIPHPALVAGSLIFNGKTVRRWLPVIERLAYYSKLPGRLLRPPAPVTQKPDLVQISGRPSSPPR